MTAYNESSIKILEGLEAVRKRPGMYIGSTDKRGLHHLVYEIVDNSIDEVLNGHGQLIRIIIHKDKSISIEDFGRGVPIGMHSSGKSTPEVIFTVLHAGGKFESSGYKVSGGLHGVGASVVNALSSKLVVTISKDGKAYEIGFKNGGELDFDLREIGKTNKTGTKVQFTPDPTIFSTTNFSFTTISERMRESCFLIKDLTVEIIDEISGKEVTYHFEDGIKEFVKYMNEDKNSLCDTLYFDESKDDIEVEIALGFTDSYGDNIISFVNNVKTIDGGTHVVGFKTALTRVFNEYARNNNILKAKDKNFEGDDIREGLTCILSLRIPENLLQFESQTKSKLGTPIARSVVDSIVFDSLKIYLEENKEVALTIIDKVLKSKMAREAAKKAREDVRNGKDKNKKEKLLSGKLTPAQTKNNKKNELYIVEGDSAAGTVKNCRDRKFQAILPLRGKVLNTEKASIEDALKNEELNSLIYAIGAGYGASFDENECNYDKVIIMTDADDDGAHIQILLLTFFYRYMRGLIEAGKLYVAMPPLYKVHYTKKDYEYLFTNEELEEVRSKKKIIEVKRFKGLGEMDADELWETTINPDNRYLIKVNIDNQSTVESRIRTLMGDKVEPRKAWIDENVEFSLEDNFNI